uniref:phosphopyruvate hydratase n=1 Tax=Strigamia maritima TaxID=126957 RepID=T1J8Q4_STRMM
MAFQGTNFKQLTESDDAITQIVNSSLPLQFLLQSTTTSTDNEAKKSEIRKSKFGDTNTTDPLEEETKKSAQMLVKSILTWGLSSAMFSAAAALNQRPLHLHLRRLYEDSGDKNPEFLVTIFHNAKAAPSKLILCSEVGVIVPTTQGFKAMVKCVQLLYKATEKVMRLKTGMSSLLTSEEGAILLTNFEKLDQVLEVVHEICSSSDVLSRGNMRYFLSCDPNETFDSERGRYEISKGVFKSCDDVVDMYVDLMKKIPLLGVLIDPLHPEDGNSWIRLSLRQEEETSCSVLTSLNVPNIVDYIETQSQSLIVPGIVVQPQIVGSISDFIKFQSLLEKLNINAIMDISALDVIDAHLIDMVIGCSASMIKIGGTVGGERAAILNRILEIDLEMESCVRDDVSDDVTSNDGTNLKTKNVPECITRKRRGKYLRIEEYPGTELFKQSIEHSPDTGFNKYLSLGQLLNGKKLWNVIKGIEIIDQEIENVKESSEHDSVSKNESIKNLHRFKSNAFCSISELYMTDYCDDVNAEEQCRCFIEKAILTDPLNPDAYQLMSSFYLVIVDHDKAREMMDKSLSLWLPLYQAVRDGHEELADGVELCPLSYSCRINAVKNCLELTQFEEAEVILNGLVEENDEVCDVWYLLGLMNELKGEDYHGNARFYFTKCKRVAAKIGDSDEEMLNDVENRLEKLGPGDDLDDEDKENEDDDDDYEDIESSEEEMEQ